MDILASTSLLLLIFNKQIKKTVKEYLPTMAYYGSHWTYVLYRCITFNHFFTIQSKEVIERKRIQYIFRSVLRELVTTNRLTVQIDIHPTRKYSSDWTLVDEETLSPSSSGLFTVEEITF
jgi:hypothetical protein